MAAGVQRVRYSLFVIRLPDGSQVIRVEVLKGMGIKKASNSSNLRLWVLF
jgi:hypothetical protein